MDVKFDAVGTGLKRITKSRQRVLGGQRRCAAMGIEEKSVQEAAPSPPVTASP
jgi:hypothetical protein